MIKNEPSWSVNMLISNYSLSHFAHVAMWIWGIKRYTVMIFMLQVFTVTFCISMAVHIVIYL